MDIAIRRERAGAAKAQRGREGPQARRTKTDRERAKKQGGRPPRGHPQGKGKARATGGNEHSWGRTGDGARKRKGETPQGGKPARQGKSPSHRRKRRKRGRAGRNGKSERKREKRKGKRNTRGSVRGMLCQESELYATRTARNSLNDFKLCTSEVRSSATIGGDCSTMVSAQ